MSSEKADPLEWFSSLRRSEIWFQIWNPLPALSSTRHFCGTGRKYAASGAFLPWPPVGATLLAKTRELHVRVGFKPEFNLMEVEDSSNCSKLFISSGQEKSLREDSCAPTGVRFHGRGVGDTTVLCGSIAGKDAGGPPSLSAPWTSIGTPSSLTRNRPQQ